MTSYTAGAMHLPIPDDTDPLANIAQTIRDMGAAIELFQGTLKPLTFVERRAALNVDSTTVSTIPWDFETTDTLGAYPGPPATDLTIPAGKDGLYMLSATAQFHASASASQIGVAIYVNGAAVIGSGGTGAATDFHSQVSCARPWPLAAGDKVNVRVRQNSGGVLTVGPGGAGTNLIMARL